MGKLCTFPLRLTVKQDEEWDGASKSEAFVFIFPTDNMTPDFLHTLGQSQPDALQHSFTVQRISRKGSERPDPTEAVETELLIAASPGISLTESEQSSSRRLRHQFGRGSLECWVSGGFRDF